MNWYTLIDSFHMSDSRLAILWVYSFMEKSFRFTFIWNYDMVLTSGSDSGYCLMKRETGANPVRTRHCKRGVQGHKCH